MTTCGLLDEDGIVVKAGNREKCMVVVDADVDVMGGGKGWEFGGGKSFMGAWWENWSKNICRKVEMVDWACLKVCCMLRRVVVLLGIFSCLKEI